MPRSRLNNRRDSRLLEFEHEGAAFMVGYSRDAGGALAELFVQGPKVGSTAAALAMDAAILASLAMQLGADSADLAHSLSHTLHGAPASAIGAALDAALADIAREAEETAAES